MTTFVWCEIVCMVCAQITAGTFTTGAIPRKEMSTTAKRCGFTHPAGNRRDWVCSDEACIALATPQKATP